MEKIRMHQEHFGNAIRMSYASIEEAIEMPNLIEIQKDSYNWFLNEGLKEVFNDISPITDFNQNLVLEFIDFRLEDELKYTIDECKDRDTTYAAPFKVRTRLMNKSLNEIKEQEIFMGDFPLMTNKGTFIINGSERVIVSQLVRSPGIYYSSNFDKVGKQLIQATVIPNRGAWLEYETDSRDVFSVRVDRTRKIPITVLIRALGVGTNEEIIEMFGEETKLMASLDKDVSNSYETGLEEIYKRIRPGEPPTIENAENLINNMFFDSKRYDLAKVGRYKFNKKLHFKYRINKETLMAHAIDPHGEIIAEKGTKLDMATASRIQNAGIQSVTIEAFNSDGLFPLKVLNNHTVDAALYLTDFDFDLEALGIVEDVHYPTLMSIIEEYKDNADELKRVLKQEVTELLPKHVTKEDILASISYAIGLHYNVGHVDDIDHLGNRRIRAVGELLQNQFRIGLSRMERVVKERMTTQAMDSITPQALINIRPVTASLKEFFGSSQLSQFMEQTNSLGELNHKRRLSALGPGGLSRDRAGVEVRDVHSSHYGRMCPIETPEGPNVGLINSLATFARINEYGFIEAPYRLIVREEGKPNRVSGECIYVTADEEENYVVAQANALLNENGEFIAAKNAVRYREDITEVDSQLIDLMDVSPKQIVSVATSLVPFLENDDVTRALMGANMQRQAVPLIKAESPIVGTGMEHKAALDSGAIVVALDDGVVERVVADNITMRHQDGKIKQYPLYKYKRSNQGTCINQRPRVQVGQKVVKGELLADGPSTDNGELALGKNPLIAFMNWEGYNYEDAVLISRKLVVDDIYTSIHIEEYEAEARDTKLGPEEIARDIPNVGEDALSNLDEHGIIRIGAQVKPDDILVGKVTPKGETELTAEERLLRAIFGEKAREVRDTSLRVPHGQGGIVVDIKEFKRDNHDELPPGVNQSVRVYVAQKRKISVGDKMAGRHGNKGVVSLVLPEEDMPYLPNGRPIDILLSPLGVPSRMNIGQVLEVHMSLAADALNIKIATPVFDGANEVDVMNALDLANDYVNKDWDEFKGAWEGEIEASLMTHLEDKMDTRADWKGVDLARDGKITLRDGRTGEAFDQRVTVGFMHYLKLDHLVEDKIHARSTGPYSLVTQQPLGGKAQFGGQRFGEMEVWALEAYGAAYTLQEILTVKSDDIVGRVKTYEAIVKGQNIPEPGIPESFKVLLKEMQALALDVRVLLNDESEVEILEDDDSDFMENHEDIGFVPEGDSPLRKDMLIVDAQGEMIDDYLVEE